MAAPTLVIGVGGTGVRVLVRIKERLLEAYDAVPPEVILLELDTDAYSGDPDSRTEAFNGVTLLKAGDFLGDRYAQPLDTEYYQVATRNIDQTLDKIFAKKREGLPEWQWINEPRLDKVLNTKQDTIVSAGAGTVRPVGRSALFLDYNTVYNLIESRLMRVANKAENPLQNAAAQTPASGIKEERKASVFVVASVAGGSGSGMVLDILRMIEHMRDKSQLVQASISVMALLVGGRAFSVSEQGKRTESNTYAALRELDRLGAVAGRALNKDIPPVMYAPQPVGRFASRLGPADMILLFDRPDRRGQERTEAGMYLERVIAPSLADIVVAFADSKITPRWQTVRADFRENYQKEHPNTGQPGFFPYCSAGIHTMIYPERDVRKSAGMRLLNDLWDNYLVSLSESSSDLDLEPVTANLWGNPPRPTGSPRLTPEAFVNEGFVRLNICSGCSNNSFIQMIVTSSLAGRIQLPQTSVWQRLFSGSNMVRRVLLLIGVPNSAGTDVNVQSLAESLENRIDSSIDELDGKETARDIIEWRKRYLGAGNLGGESHGEWLRLLRSAPSVRGHQADFQDALQKAIAAVLNDVNETGECLPYRLEYARRMLAQLKTHIQRVTIGDPKDDKRPSLLSDFFREEIKRETKAREDVKKWESKALQEQSVRNYQKANTVYAKAKKDLVGMELLRVLCDDLLAVVEDLENKLVEWQRFLRTVRQEVGKRQQKHEQSRLEKAKIPVRTYLCHAPKNGYFKDGELENQLYQKHANPALSLVRRGVKWEWAGDQFELTAPFGRKPATDMKPPELVERAINWACTIGGNADRPDEPAPLGKLGRPEEIPMPVAIRDHFGQTGDGAVVACLTGESYLASLCPLDNWPPSKRCFYGLGLPSHADTTLYSGVDTFFARVQAGVRGQAAGGFIERDDLRVFDPENPRHAVAIEFAVGFKLEQRRDRDTYITQYRKDTDKYSALHCLPEEDVASIVYEPEFKLGSELYGELALQPMLLDPAVVDLLGSPERLELFVQATAVGIIGFLENRSEGADLHLWPRLAANKRIRLSKMHTQAEILTAVQDLAPSASVQSAVTTDPKIIERLRVMYALRTFILKEMDVDDARPLSIDYTLVAREVDKRLMDIPLAERIKWYKTRVGRYLEYYKDHASAHPMLAHLGLVLARVADELRKTEETKTGGPVDNAVI